MSREIKFRALWEHMPSRERIWQFATVGVGGFHAPFGYTQITIWEQYTGLNDCNGVEIYEGDILTCNNNHIWLASFNDRGQFVARDPDDALNFVLLDDWDFKVCGNIHENPELLK